MNYWGNGALPSCGQPHYLWVEPSAMAPDAHADADPDTCEIRFNVEVWHKLSGYPPGICHLELHEMGHLYGQEHSTNTYSIMAAKVSPKLDPMRYSACKKTIKRLVPFGWALRTGAP